MQKASVHEVIITMQKVEETLQKEREYHDTLTSTPAEIKFSKCGNHFGLAKHTLGVFKIIEKGVGHLSGPLYSAQDTNL